MTSCLQTVVHTLIDIQKNEKSAVSLPRSLPRERRISSTTTKEMPSASPAKCRGSVVRQLSLQNPLQSPTSRGLKKQLSEDDARTLDVVEVTGQRWGVAERPEPILRINSGDGRIGQGKIGTRPKPVKVAWADRKPESAEAAGVAVIATKCRGQPRPTSVKTQRLRSPLLGNKDTLVYSRLQLAERLRNAWSEREKMKPNINIFLAHASDINRNEPATDRPTGTAKQQDAASALSDSVPLDKKRKSMPVRAFSEDFCHSETFNLKDDVEKDEQEGRHLQELNKIEIRMTEIKRGAEGSENKPPEPEEVWMKRSRGKPEEAKPETPENVTAQDRRANFRRSSILHKTITESFSDWPKEDEKKAEENLKQKKPPLLRTFSAPSQNQADSKAVNLQKKVKVARKLQPSVSFDIPCTAEDVGALRDRIKSAPIRRKLKSAAARRKSKDKVSSDEEKEIKESTAAGKKTTRRHVKSGGEIVTMVSLVSPAESDTEDSVINLPDESWEGREKEEAKENRNSTSGSVDETKDSSTFVMQKFVSLRKATKSVTFHPHPILNRSYSASFPSRRVPAGTPIIVPTPVISNPALTPAQLLERDRRPPTFAGADARGIKRRFLRSSSESPKDDDSSGEKYEGGKTPGKSEEHEDNGEEKADGEPEFKCQKEKECWTLYQKMIEKGVSVSFDTVLRGMLTPTEYRLRKSHLLSHC